MMSNERVIQLMTKLDSREKLINSQCLIDIAFKTVEMIGKKSRELILFKHLNKFIFIQKCSS